MIIGNRFVTGITYPLHGDKVRRDWLVQKAYDRKLRREAAKRGSEVKIEIYEGLHHVFQRCVQSLPSARRAFDSAAHFLSTHWYFECP